MLEVWRRLLTAASPMLALPIELVVPARTAILMDMPAAPKIINGRRPNFSTVKIAIHDAIQYSVPLQADSSRLRKGDRPILFSKIVAA